MPATRPSRPAAATRYGARFRLSVLLLLAAFNTVLLAGLTAAGFAALLEGPRPDLVTGVEALQQRVEAVQSRVLAQERLGSDDRGTLDELGGVAAALPDEAVTREFAAWRAALEAWAAAAARRPPGTEPPSPGAVVLARNRLSGALALLVTWERPAWVDELARRMPYLMAWVLGSALVTMVMAWRLQVMLTVPLARVAAAAEAVAEGHLDTRIPAPRALPELATTARSLEAMRQQLVDSLRELRARGAMRGALLCALGDGVLLVDRSGRIVERNPRVGEIFALLGVEGPVDRLELVLPEIPRAALSGRDPVDMEVIRPRPQGGRVHLEVAVRPLDVEGPLAGHAVVVLRDVTQAQEVEQLKRDFLSVVTHELKTPLTAIDGYTRLLLSGRGGPLTGRQERFLSTIREQTAQLAEMVQNLLDSSRLEGGQLSFRFEEVEALSFLDGVVETWRPAAEQRGIRLVGELDAAAGLTLRADPQRLRQVFGNLVNNALKFTPDGGVIRIAARGEADGLVVEVADTGPGIPPSEVDRVFDKFHQVARGDTRPSGGAGLGLYIVRQLVEAHGGSVRCHSDGVRGTTFTVRLPLDGEAPRARSA